MVISIANVVLQNLAIFSLENTSIKKLYFGTLNTCMCVNKAIHGSGLNIHDKDVSQSGGNRTTTNKGP